MKFRADSAKAVFPEIKTTSICAEGLLHTACGLFDENSTRAYAKRVMLGVWSFLRQFMYTKLFNRHRMTTSIPRLE